MMRNNFHSKKLSDEAKLNAKWFKTYKSWEKVMCPAFQKDVFFTNKGWHHIQNEKWRTRSEKEARLNMLPVAKFIISKASLIQEQRLQPYHGTIHQHYGFVAIVSNVQYKVVIIEDRGQLDYLSVYRM